MHQSFLYLVPKRYFCPFCGKWHNWKLTRKLGYFDSLAYSAELGCENQIPGCNNRKMEVYFSDGYCHYRTTPTCSRGNLDINNIIRIEDIVESYEKPRVTFSIPFTAADVVGVDACSDCDSKDVCLMCKLGTENCSRNMRIPFGFEFERSDYEKLSGIDLPAFKDKELQEQEHTIYSNASALKEQEDAASKEQFLKQSKVKENKEDTTMSNNIFNMNLEFGPNKDENIASTLLGVAVKNGENWRIYDKEKKEITDIGNMQLGNLPIFIIPTTKLKEGDLIKDEGEYYFVTKEATPETPTQTLSARTGEIRSVVPIKNVLGFSCYSKVVAISDSANLTDDFDVKEMAIMSAMVGQNGNNQNQMNQLLPALLFKDKLGGEGDNSNLLLIASLMGGNMAGRSKQLLTYLMLDYFKDKKEDTGTQMSIDPDDFPKEKSDKDEGLLKLLLISSMMTPQDSEKQKNGVQMNQLLPIMLFKDKLEGYDDILKLLLISSMMPPQEDGEEDSGDLPF